MLRYLISSFLLVFIFSFHAQEQFRVVGTIYDEINEPLPFAKILLMSNGEMVQGTHSDVDGMFVFDKVLVGEYQVVAQSVGYSDQVKDIEVKKKDVELHLEMYSQAVLLKPIIYLYPEETTEVSVQLDYKGELLYTYPVYPQDGWNVSASPDGTLISLDTDKEYYALFWEGVPHQQLSIGESGFVVKGEETVAFLEEALATLGLNRREAMEFIIFWQPRMQNNPYNLIHFSTEEYEALAGLTITPTPETIIRVMMVFEPLMTPIAIDQQNLSELKKVRKGFTVVEWGGTELKPHLSKK